MVTCLEAKVCGSVCFPGLGSADADAAPGKVTAMHGLIAKFTIKIAMA